MATIQLESLDFLSLPATENDLFEYKSSTTPQSEIKTKLNRAASGFSNSGGGCIFIGIDKQGNADGGIETVISRQSVRDWADQIVKTVSPTVKYEVKLFDNVYDRGHLDPGKAILAVSFPESTSAPHMAEDKKYYIRAGAHTEPASNYLVEALFAKRVHSRPYLSHVVRLKPGNKDIVQIGIVSLTSAPAVNARITFSEFSSSCKLLRQYYPLHIPVIDQSNPHYIDAGIYFDFSKQFPDNVQLIIEYEDIKAAKYMYESSRPLSESLNPNIFGSDPLERIAKSLDSLCKKN